MSPAVDWSFVWSTEAERRLIEIWGEVLVSWDGRMGSKLRIITTRIASYVRDELNKSPPQEQQVKNKLDQLKKKGRRMIKKIKRPTGSDNPEEDIDVDVEKGTEEWINFDMFVKHFSDHPAYALRGVDDSALVNQAACQSREDIEHSDVSRSSSVTAAFQSDSDDEDQIAAVKRAKQSSRSSPLEYGEEEREKTVAESKKAEKFSRVKRSQEDVLGTLQEQMQEKQLERDSAFQMKLQSMQFEHDERMQVKWQEFEVNMEKDREVRARKNMEFQVQIQKSLQESQMQFQATLMKNYLTNS